MIRRAQADSLPNASQQLMLQATRRPPLAISDRGRKQSYEQIKQEPPTPSKR